MVKYWKLDSPGFLSSIFGSGDSSQAHLQNLAIDQLSTLMTIYEHESGMITISVLMQKEKTLCNVNSDVKLSLKTVILYPIIKKEYNSFLSGVFKKMSIDAKQTKEK